LVVAVLLLLASAQQSAHSSTAPLSLAGALGEITAIVMTAILIVALIVSGIPKWIGPPDFMRFRRRRYFILLGLGLLLMVAGAVALGFSGYVAAGVLLTWLYWFGWTWIAWLMADRRARVKFGDVTTRAA